MPEEANTMELALPARMRIHLTRPANWLQLVRFSLVGASGYAVNLVVFTLCVDVLVADYHAAAVVAFVCGLLNNFFWNRHWTFRASDGHAGWQAARFVVVSVVAFGFSFSFLHTLVDGAGVAKVTAQALAIGAAMPLNFLGNRFWSFRA